MTYLVPDWILSCFKVLAVMNSAVVNPFMHVILHVCEHSYRLNS